MLSRCRASNCFGNSRALHCFGTASLTCYCKASRAVDKLNLPGCAFFYLLTSRMILQEHHLKNGYQLLYTPHVAKAEMWKTSGHLDFYAENMFDRIKVCLSSESCKSLCFGKAVSTSECKILLKRCTCSHQPSKAPMPHRTWITQVAYAICLTNVIFVWCPLLHHLFSGHLKRILLLWTTDWLYACACFMPCQRSVWVCMPHRLRRSCTSCGL